MRKKIRVKFSASAGPLKRKWGGGDGKLQQGIPTEGEGRLSTIDLLIKVSCFVKKVNNIFNTKRCLSKLVSTRRSTVLNLPFNKTSVVVVVSHSFSTLPPPFHHHFEDVFFLF